jgi:hypothetical protein
MSIHTTSKSSPEKKAKETQKSSSAKKFSIPMGASIEDIRRAIRILSDSGGQARINDIGTSFGTKSSDRTMLGWALNAAVAFGLIESHKRRAPYVLSNDGKKFLSSTEDQQKAMLLPKFLGFEGYREILVGMKNSPDKALKKQTITDMWLQVRDKVKLGTRQYYTTTFASVGTWCGAITDTGQTCSLTPEGEPVLEQILKGEKVKTTAPAAPPASPPSGAPIALSFQVTNCPHCGKTEFNIENEELLNTVSADGNNVLIIKYTFYCRGCRGTFSRIGQQTIRTD